VRALFLLLVAANLAFFAWTRFGTAPDAPPDREPLRRQIEPDKIRVLRGAELDRLPAPKPKPAPGAEAAAPASAPPAAPAAAPAACLEWGGFAIAEAQRAQQALAPLALGPRLAQRRSEETASWWVFIPPQANRATAQKKAGELKALGVGEYFVVQDEGPVRWSISLGVFTTEDAAKSRLEALKAKGVRSAQIGKRETQVTKVWYQIRNVEAPLQARLRETAQDFPGTEVRDCPPQAAAKTQ